MDVLISSSNFHQLSHLTPSFNVKKPTQQPHIKASFTKNNPFKLTSQPFDQLLIKRDHGLISKQALGIPTNKNPSLLTSFFNTLDDLVCRFLDPPLRPSIDPRHVLSGHSAPVIDELSPTACKVVEGSLPPCLDGAYIRNGPNPQFSDIVRYRPFHFFEGDGMLHTIRISRGEATFCSRYVKTHKYEAEREAGYPFVPGVFSSFNGVASSVARLALVVARVGAGQFDPKAHGMGTSNVNVAMIGGRLFALSESDLPYEVRVTADGDVVTLGRHDLESGDPTFLRMTAHPKTDGATGETFAYEYDVNSPFLTFFRTDSAGRKQKGVPIRSMDECTAMHDFALTQNYVVFPDGQMVVRQLRVFEGKSPVAINHGKVQRLGIMPKYAKDDTTLRWIDTPGLNIMHCVNAWEDGDRIVIIGSNGMEVEQFLEDFRLSELRLEKITVDVRTETVESERLSAKNLDLGVINPAYYGKKNRYVYAAITNETSWIGVVKLDLSIKNTSNSDDYTVASRLYEPGCSGGEPFFVAREPSNPSAEEDDGYLITYIHDEKTRESRFLVMYAKSPTLDIVAAVKLPQRVPDGFHGLFVPESDLGIL